MSFNAMMQSYQYTRFSNSININEPYKNPDPNSMLLACEDLAAEYELAEDENRNYLPRVIFGFCNLYIISFTPPTFGLFTISSLTASNALILFNEFLH